MLYNVQKNWLEVARSTFYSKVSEVHSMLAASARNSITPAQDAV